MVAMAGKNCVAIASDRRMGVQLVRVKKASAYGYMKPDPGSEKLTKCHVTLVDNDCNGCNPYLSDARQTVPRSDRPDDRYHDAGAALPFQTRALLYA